MRVYFRTHYPVIKAGNTNIELRFDYVSSSYVYTPVYTEQYQIYPQECEELFFKNKNKRWTIDLSDTDLYRLIRHFNGSCNNFDVEIKPKEYINILEYLKLNNKETQNG